MRRLLGKGAEKANGTTARWVWPRCPSRTLDLAADGGFTDTTLARFDRERR